MGVSGGRGLEGDNSACQGVCQLEEGARKYLREDDKRCISGYVVIT